MRNHNIKKQFWFNNEQAETLKKKSKKAGVTESTFTRNLIMGCQIKEKPDDRFYDVMKQMRYISNNLNQIAIKVNKKKGGFFDELAYKREIEKLNKFMLQVKQEYLISK